LVVASLFDQFLEFIHQSFALVVSFSFQCKSGVIFWAEFGDECRMEFVPGVELWNSIGDSVMDNLLSEECSSAGFHVGDCPKDCFLIIGKLV
jgi:hypothetical protein